MKIWSSNFIFNHPWKQTAEAVWKKYPNDEMPNVLTIDVLDRRVCDGKLLTTRLFSSDFTFPRLITQLLGLPEVCYAVEHSEVDVKSRKVTLRTINYTFVSVLTVNEKLVYSQSEDNPNETLLKQGAKVHIHGIPFKDYFEDMIINKFDTTSQRGRLAMQKVLKTVTVEHIVNAVIKELEEISSYIDEAACNLTCNISERVEELCKDLDRASDIINSEFQTFSNRYSDYIDLVGNLYDELSEVSVKMRTSNEGLELYETVKQAGFTAKMPQGL